jgi:hypothetical protein
MVSADEPGLWLPYGRRRVECLLPDDSPEGLRSQGIHYVVVDASAIGSSDRTIGRWLSRFHATLVDQYTFPKSTGRTGDGPDLYVVRLN